MRKLKFNAKTAIGLLAAAALFAVPRGVLADSSPLLLTVPADGFSIDGSLTVTTNAMPKGWFTGNQNSFDRTKTDIRVSVDISASDCSAETTLTKSSVADGTFAPILNSQGKPTAWRWSITLNLDAYRDHWHSSVGRSSFSNDDPY